MDNRFLVRPMSGGVSGFSKSAVSHSPRSGLRRIPESSSGACAQNEYLSKSDDDERKVDHQIDNMNHLNIRPFFSLTHRAV